MIFGFSTLMKQDQREEYRRLFRFNEYYAIDTSIKMNIGGKLKHSEYDIERLVSFLITNWSELKSEIMAGNSINYFFRSPIQNPVTNTKEMVEGFVNVIDGKPSITFVGYKEDRYNMPKTMIKEVMVG